MVKIMRPGSSVQLNYSPVRSRVSRVVAMVLYNFSFPLKNVPIFMYEYEQVGRKKKKGFEWMSILTSRPGSSYENSYLIFLCN